MPVAGTVPLTVYCFVEGSENCEHFEIDAAIGRITMTAPRRDVPFSSSCILKIIASDAGQPHRQTVRYITVNTLEPSLCADDLPSLNISFTIEENTPPGSIVGYLSASEYFDDINSNDDVTDPDPDRGTFRLVAGNALDTFSVDSVTGALVIGGPVDFEVCSRYGLVVWIFDRIGKCVGELSVEVVVVNVNDNPPQFDADLTYIMVREATPPGAEIYATLAHDPDGFAIFYAAREEQSSVGVSSWLAVDDVRGHVVTRRSLDGAPRQMHVVITATDVSDDVIGDVSGHTTSMTLVVTVVKDAPASCGRGRGLVGDRTQRVAVVEDTEVGSVITAAETDDDAITSWCELTPSYSIVYSSDYNTFTIDRFTGQLTLTVTSSRETARRTLQSYDWRCRTIL